MFIAHRGNTQGPNPEQENKPQYIIEALKNNFDVEIDVWLCKNNKWYLGHDKPQYAIDYSFLENEKLWCHAKNLEALSIMLQNPKIHCFWHQQDDYTITSKKFIWAYPGKKILPNSNTICVMPEWNDFQFNQNNIIGICSDYVMNERQKSSSA